MWLGLIACYVIVKTVSSERLHVVMQHQSSALSLTAQERLLLSWDMWERWLRFSPSAFTGTRAKCVSLCECAAIATHSRRPHIHKRACFLAHGVCAVNTCLMSVFMVFVRCVVVKCDSNIDTHTHNTHCEQSIFLCVLWVMLLFLSVWHLLKA